MGVLGYDWDGTLELGRGRRCRNSLKILRKQKNGEHASGRSMNPSPEVPVFRFNDGSEHMGVSGFYRPRATNKDEETATSIRLTQKNACPYIGRDRNKPSDGPPNPARPSSVTTVSDIHRDSNWKNSSLFVLHTHEALELL